MSNMFLKLVGKFSAAIGALDNYSSEHQKFLSSGYICPHCGKTLMKRWGIADVKCYTTTGEKVPLIAARQRGEIFECPECQYRWRLRVTSKRGLK